MYKLFIRPILFQIDPEKVHHWVFRSLKFFFSIPGVRFFVKKKYQVKAPELTTEICGLKFPSPVGLAAGLDKNAQLINILPAFGFGFIEIGTVTPKPQEGNPKPRLFRLKSDSALINRMGFNNDGVDKILKRLKKRRSNIIIGGNIGKNKVTPNEEAVNDYLTCFEALYDHVDFFTVNVSSPNTPNLRALQDKEPLSHLLFTLQKVNHTKANPKPIFLKIAPDLTHTQLDEIIEIVEETQIAGVIATNTTINRHALKTSKTTLDKIGNGGLSGKPLNSRSTEVIRYIHKKSEGKVKIIGVGGIHSAEDAIEKLLAGASLVQIYTGFIYEGPDLVKEINKAVLRSQKKFI
ncbi:quinone-dependent dihydroorotate dehydrogenase [Rapidithrix thailandica]|uniref:Dihydroorotate dehydrogenase (quinone) n=1 Tax=Rapidithrix thailandica TaxID=413964 RepID=A0AAW9S815_9BACT